MSESFHLNLKVAGMPTHNEFHAFYVIEKLSRRSRAISSANRAASVKDELPKAVSYAVARMVDSHHAVNSR